MLNLLVSIVLIALVFYALFWFIGYIGLPEPFDKILKVLVGLFALICVLNLLTGGGLGFAPLSLKY